MARNNDTHLHIRIDSKSYNKFKEICDMMGLVASKQVREMINNFNNYQEMNNERNNENEQV